MSNPVFWKKKKNMINLSSVKLAQRVVKAYKQNLKSCDSLLDILPLICALALSVSVAHLICVACNA